MFSLAPIPIRRAASRSRRHGAAYWKSHSSTSVSSGRLKRFLRLQHRRTRSAFACARYPSLHGSTRELAPCKKLHQARRDSASTEGCNRFLGETCPPRYRAGPPSVAGRSTTLDVPKGGHPCRESSRPHFGACQRQSTASRPPTPISQHAWGAGARGHESHSPSALPRPNVYPQSASSSRFPRNHIPPPRSPS